jgi:surface antigen
MKTIKKLKTLKTLTAATLVALTGIHTASATNYFPQGWCTYGAAALFDKVAPAPGLDWNGDAGTWFDNAKAKGWVTNTDPRLAEVNALIVWKSVNGVGGGAGHVGMVKQVLAGGIIVTEMNWGKQIPDAEAGWTYNHDIYTTRTLTFASGLSSPSFKFAGFVMPRKTAAYTSNTVLNNQALADLQVTRLTNWKFGGMVGNLSVNRNWDPNFELRYAQFSFIWPATTWIYHATYKNDPKQRYTTYMDIYTGQWVGWNRVK